MMINYCNMILTELIERELTLLSYFRYNNSPSGVAYPFATGYYEKKLMKDSITILYILYPPRDSIFYNFEITIKYIIKEQVVKQHIYGNEEINIKNIERYAKNCLKLVHKNKILNLIK